MKILAVLRLALRTVACVLLLSSTCADPADLVGPGALERRRDAEGSGGGAGQEVTSYPVGFYIAGSSIVSINGLYEKQNNQDYTLPHLCDVMWRKADEGRGPGVWSLCVVEKSQQLENQHENGVWNALKFKPIDGANSEWILSDKQSRGRFSCPGGQFLPEQGAPAWRHTQYSTRYEPLQKGDRAKTRGRLNGFWEMGEDGVVEKVMGMRERRNQPGLTPIFWRRQRDQKLFNVQGFRVWGGWGQTRNDTNPAEEDEDEVPWQVVPILSHARMQELKQRLSLHMIEVQAAIGAGQSHTHNRNFWEHQWRLFSQVRDSLDGSKALAEENKNDSAAAAAEDQDREKEPFLCRAAVAIGHLEALLRMNRNFAPTADPQWDPHSSPRYSDVDERRAGGLLPWLILAHSRARRCRGRRPHTAMRTDANPERAYPPPGMTTSGKRVVAAGVAPVVGEWRIGDFVETKEPLRGFWAKGDVARLVGLGRTNAPMAVRMESGQSAGKLVDVQEERLLRHTPRLPRLPHPGWGDLHRAPSLPPTRPPSAVSADADAGVGTDAGAGTGTAKDALPIDYYELLGVGAEFTAQELRKAYRQTSLRLHPDKPQGSPEAFQAAAEAHAVLSNPHLRRKYDAGDDLFSEQPFSLEEEIERFYFPERRGFRIFGDPLKQKRARQEARWAQQERERENERQRDVAREEAKLNSEYRYDEL